MFQGEGTKISKAQYREVIGLFMQCRGDLCCWEATAEQKSVGK